MNRLTVRQRKLAYAAGAVLMLVPIVLIGGPPGEEPGAGWLLAQKRHEYELGESSLGDVDPTSATMNLVLLGLRGVAASLLWQQADHLKDTKNFAQLEQTVESIILLQPHFKTVWEYQAWNLAFNVSAECDAVEDRFFWVKRGAKFLIRGTRRNQKVPELFFETGRFFGQKLGRSDEKDIFREYIRNDPDTERWKGGPDEELNPDGKDNYLIARDWYTLANEKVELPGVEQHKMDLALFVAYPHKALMSYATARQEDGVKTDLDLLSSEERDRVYREWSEVNRDAWTQAYDEWTQIYGRREIETPGGAVILEPDDDALAAISDEDGIPLTEKKHWRDRYRKTVNYLYWKQRCDIERRPLMMESRYELAEGRRQFREVQDFEEARRLLESGMAKLDQVIAQYDREDGTNSLLTDEVDVVEDAIKAILIWQQVLVLLGEEQPEDFPLKRVWTHPDYQQTREELYQNFLLWQGSSI